LSALPSRNPLWDAHLARLHGMFGPDSPTTPSAGRQRTLSGDREAVEARSGEWTASPPGRLGRRLLADVEPYLEFFAVARAD
jgi:hypothetical protein